MVDTILNGIQSAIFWLLLKIDSIVYTFIDWIYQIILMLADGDILGNTNIVDELINRLYLIIGVIILFLVAYSLLRSMVNPDEALKGKESPVKIIQNVIISVVLIALVPYIFNFAMDFQNSLLRQNTIGRLILGEGNAENSSSETIDNGGFNIAINVFSAFFQPNTSAGYCTGNPSIDQNYPDCTMLSDTIDGTDYYTWWNNEVYEAKNFGAIADASDLVANERISYTFIISTIAGAYVVYVLAIYCIEIAIRLVKLAVFQLIAPLPILARIVPKEDTKKMFSNWLKATISTYVEVFIRLAMLFFAVFMINLVVNNFTTIFNMTSDNWTINPVLALIAQALVILGIIMFIKQLPQLIKDITGMDSGKYGKALIKGAGMLAASIGGGTTAAIRRTVTDKREHPEMGSGQRAARTLSALGGGMRRGLWQGSKVDKFGDIKKAAGRTASDTLSHTAQIDAAGGGLKGTVEYYRQKGKNTITDIQGWVSGSFEAQQQMLDEVNAFLSDAKAIKSTTEGLVRDKKYLFSMVGKGQEAIKKTTADGEVIILDENTSLSAVDSIIQSLKATGKVADAKLADEINNDMQQRIKKIGQAMAVASVDRSKVPKFNDDFMMSGKDIQSEAMPTLATAASQYTIVQQRYAKDSALDAVIRFQTDENGEKRDLQPDNVSKLADSLEAQAADISKTIKLEQERRKASAPKGGKDK